MRLRRSFHWLVALSFAGVSSAGGERRPVSSGSYEIRIGGERIGDERFELFEKKGYRLDSTRTAYWPEPMRYEYHYEMKDSWSPKKLKLTTTRGGNFTELTLEPKGKNWRLEVKGRGRKNKKHELGRREGTVVDFGSVLFTGLVLRGLGLEPGGERSLDAIVLTLPDLAGARVAQVYRRVEDEEIESELRGTVEAAVYEVDSSGRTHRLWVDPSGIVLKATLDRPGGEQEVVLTQFKGEPGAWSR